MTLRMRTLKAAAGLAAMVAICSVAAAWQAIRATIVEKPRKGAAVSIVSQLNFRFDSAFIWSMLTSREGLEAATGLTLEQADGDEPLSTMGDSIGVSAESLKGRLVVTRFDRPRELRLVFEPDDASHVMTMRFLLATAGNGCVIHYWRQYTDFGEDVDERAAKSKEGIVSAANAFRALVEARVQPRGSHGGH